MAINSADNLGFSLIELLLVMTLTGIVASISAAPLASMLARQNIRTTVHLLQRDFHLARQQATLLNREVSVCPSLDSERCTLGKDWSAGWISFINVDRDRPAQRDAGEAILSVQNTTPGASINANRSALSFRSLQYRSTNGSFIICDAAQRSAPRGVVVSYSGRPRSVDFVELPETLGCL